MHASSSSPPSHMLLGLSPATTDQPLRPALLPAALPICDPPSSKHNLSIRDLWYRWAACARAQHRQLNDYSCMQLRKLSRHIVLHDGTIAAFTSFQQRSKGCSASLIGTVHARDGGQQPQSCCPCCQQRWLLAAALCRAARGRPDYHCRGAALSE